MTDSTHALHMRGDHRQCDYLHCEELQAEELANWECMFAKAVFAAIKRRGGDPNTILGDEYDRYRENASTRQREYLPNRPGPAQLIQANMMVREAMEGVPVLWTCEDYDTDDDFDVDAFLAELT